MNVILEGKRDFVDGIKLRTPRWGNYSGLPGWALSVITRVLVKGKESVRAEGRMTDQRRGWYIFKF